jgi:DHA3 family macrolide efflux protein-like MFS transporter
VNKNIVLLWQGQFVSQLGSQAFSITMMFWLMEAVGSSAIMGSILAISLLPSIILGPIAGVIADRYSRKFIIVIADLVRGFSVLGLALALFFNHENTQFIVILFFIVSIFNGTSKAFFQPAIDACIPDLVSSKALGKTMAFFGISSQISMLLGQALGGLLYRFLGAPVLLLVDAISYIYSGLSEMFIKIEHVKKPLTQKSIGDVLHILISEMKEGFDYLKQNSGLFKMIGIVSSINFFVAPIMLFLPFYVSEHIKLGADWYGFMLASMALGSVIGYLLSPTLNC